MPTYLRQLQDTEGAGGGKGGGGGGGSESPDTLVTNETIQMLHLIGEGEVNLYTGDGQSIYLNNTPLVNPNGSYNYGAYDEATGDTDLYTGGGTTYWEWRNGAPSQTVMSNPAFPSASSVYSLNEQIFGGSISLPAAPVIYATVSAADYCLVEISFPSGIEMVDSNNNIVGDEVSLAIDVAPSGSSSWVRVLSPTISDKSDSAAALQYQVNNPNPGSLWQFRVSRLTADNDTATRKNDTFVGDVVEVEKVSLPYNGVALCGLALDASTVGGMMASIPTMSFLVAKGPIAIPSNYTPATSQAGSATFAGTWDGTFTTGLTDDPAWVLYDLLTNTKYGCGLSTIGITPGMIDAGSFYNASVFNNEHVPDGNGGSERRFTFNAPIQSRQDLLVSLQQVASMMNACLSMVNGLITLYQDQPTESTYLVQKASCIPDDPNVPVYFQYSSNDLVDRSTVVNCTWTNSSNNQFLPYISSVSDATYLAKYGANTYDLAAFGATYEGQALRAGKWYLYEQLYNNEQVVFKSGPEAMIYKLYDVFDLFDDDYAGTAVGGRVVSATTSTITLDQPVVITGASSKISLFMLDGVTYTTYTITNAPGTYQTLSISGTFSTVPPKYTRYGITSGVSPRQFRITDLQRDGVTKITTVTAKRYSSTNYTYVEGSGAYAIPSAVYSNSVPTSPLPPTGVSAKLNTIVNPNNSQLSYGIILSWTRPTSQNIGYQVKWAKSNGQWNTTPMFTSAQYELDGLGDGTYDFLVYSINLAGNYSQPASCTFNLDTSGGGTTTAFTDVTDFYVNGTTGTTWTGVDLPITWTNPPANAATVKDFLVTVSTTGGTQLRQVVVDAVVAGAAQLFDYTFAMNSADNSGSPQRSLVVNVQCRDVLNDLSTGSSATFTNAAPAVPSDIDATAAQQSAIITWDPETDVDVQGYLVWFSTTNGFTPSSGNVTDCGLTAIASFLNLAKATTYYYRVAAYDVFGKALDGTGLNVSSQLSTATPTNVGIPASATAPGSATTGDFYFNTTDKTLYRYTGTAWTNATDGSTINPASITTSELAVGSVTASILAANAVTAVSIAASAVTTAALAVGAVTATNIDVSTLSAITANLGSITAGDIYGAVVRGGSFTGWAWPTSGTGFYLSSNGLLLGNYNTGQYIQLNQDGSMSMPGMSCAGGTLTISQLDVIGTLNIAGNAVTSTMSAVSTASVGAVQYFTISADQIPAGGTTVPVEITGTIMYSSISSSSMFMDIAIFPGIYDMAASTSITFNVQTYILTYTYPDPFPTGAVLGPVYTETITTTPWATAGNAVSSAQYYSGAYTVTILQQLAAGTYTVACYDHYGTDGWMSGMSYAGLSTKVISR